MHYYTFVFNAIIIAVHGSSLRNVGLSDGEHQLPAIEIVLTANANAVGYGNGGASQEIFVAADGIVPQETGGAGVSAIVEQDIDIHQITLVDKPNLSSTSLNGVSVENIANAHEAANILTVGGNSLVFDFAGATSATGAGSVAAGITSSNTTHSNNN